MKNNIKITKTQSSRLSTVDFNNLPFGRIFSDHMFIVDYENGVWVNPRIVPFEHFPMHPGSMVLHYGQAIFEGMKASKGYDGTPFLFRPEMHAKRLNASAERMCMPTLPEDLFLEGLHALVGVDADWIPPQEGSALYLRPFMIATDEFIGVRPSDHYRFMIITCPVGPYYSKPVRLKVETEYVRAVNGGTGEAKAAGNYAGSLLPARKAQQAGFDQVMWMDGHEFRYIQEVGTMNIFFVIDGKVITPATDGAILKGITRDCVLTILRDKGYEVEERPLTIDEVLDAFEAGTLQEVFGTGTAAVIAHVAEISYKGRELILPPVADRKVAQFVFDQINGLRAGKIADSHQWIVPVNMDAMVGA
ncbi:MAG: branched-chain amino acid aminotransferase [Lewinellaceae bacterium]|nr:branched-chain amino acid aminotransferase [Lewinellaceae bacterium]